MNQKISKKVLVHERAGETNVAIIERSPQNPQPRVAEIYVERSSDRSIVGNIYKGRVENVLTGLEAAFIDIGLDKNGFLHLDEIRLPGRATPRRGRGKNQITDYLKPGQEVIVQVVKDPLKSKGARLSMELSLAGRYLVYNPQGSGAAVSRRLEDNERARLRKIAQSLGADGGLIVRTAAKGVDASNLGRELPYLHKLHEVVARRVEKVKAPALVFQEADLPVRVVRDLASHELDAVIVDSDSQIKRMESFFSRTAPEIAKKIETHKGNVPLFESYKINDTLETLLSPRVDLPSGGYIVIDYAEAMTVIDVNSGSFVGRGKGMRLEDTITKTNLEAAAEVVNQLRLRDIGGIIVIDFIDMAQQRNRREVLKTLSKALEQDSTKTTVMEISQLGLVEMTRENVSEGVREIITNTCPTCDGRGVIRSEETLAIDAYHQLTDLVRERTEEAFLVQMNPDVVRALNDPKVELLRALESETGKEFYFEGTDSIKRDYLEITFAGSRMEVQSKAHPFSLGDEVWVQIVEPHMYRENDAVAKVGSCIITVMEALPYVGTQQLVRIDLLKRSGAKAVVISGNDTPTPQPPVKEISAPPVKQTHAKEKVMKGSAKGNARKKPHAHTSTPVVPPTDVNAVSQDVVAENTPGNDDIVPTMEEKQPSTNTSSASTKNLKKRLGRRRQRKIGEQKFFQVPMTNEDVYGPAKPTAEKPSE